MDTIMSQMEMYQQSRDKVLGRMKAFNEIMSGPNPLTQEEIRGLIKKRPYDYGFMKAFLREGEEER
jgi:hypothetical protein